MSFSAISIQSAEETYFELLAGFNAISIKASDETYFALLAGLSSISFENEWAVLLRIVDEAGAPFVGTISISVESDEGNYSDIFDSPGGYILDPFTTGGVSIPHTITITDGTLTRTYTLTPTLGGTLTLALTRVPINAILLVDAIGNIDSILQVQNAVLTDSTAWDGDSPKAISFPVSGGVSDEPFFYFAREQAHLRLTADITYEVVPGRPITETFTNIAIAP
jgi:hypothetical protein